DYHCQVYDSSTNALF
nr:immunoglobulin light chain junction region [Macaca mulatta]